ncbi:MAG: glycosyltransferase, partial [Desulfobacterales bacterium]
HADLVTYPSTYEGFGNAFLEAVYYRKPIVVNTYSIYEMDIKPKGFSTVEINGYITEKAVQDTIRVLSDPGWRKEIVDRNYEIAKRYYSYAVLEGKLRTLLADCIDCDFDCASTDMPKVY